MTDKQISVLLRAITGPYNAAMAKAGATTQTFGQVGDRAAGKVDQFSGHLKGATGKLMAGGGFLFALDQGVDRLTSYEGALTGVGKTTGLAGDELFALGDDLTGLSQEIKGSAEDMAGIAQIAAQLGVSGSADILEFTETVAGIASATDLTEEAAATDMARLANIMQLPISEIGRLGSTIVGLGNTMATTEPEILSMAQRLAGAGDLAGFTAAEVMGLAAAASEVGIQAEAGGTALSQVLRGIEEAAQTGGAELDVFAEIAGQSAQEFAQSWESDPTEAFETFMAGLARVRDEGGNVAEIFDTLGLDGMRVSDTLLRLSGSADQVSSAFDAANGFYEENVALTEEVETANATLSTALDNLSDKVDQQIRDLMGGAESAYLYTDAVNIAGDGIEYLDDALQLIPMSLGQLSGAYGDVQELLGRTTEETTEAEIAQRDLAQSMVDWGGAAAAYMDTNDDVAGSSADLADQLHDTRQAQRDLADEMLAATDPAWAFIDAQDEARQAAQDYAAALEDPEASAQDVEQALYDMIRAQERADAAALASGPAFAELTARIDELEDQGRLTAAQADEMREKILGARDAAQDLAGNYNVNLDIQIRGMQAATDRLTAMARRYGHEPRARGGPVFPDGSYLVGEEGPELFRPASTGRIIPARETAAMTSTSAPTSVTYDQRQYTAQLVDTSRDDALMELRKMSLRYS